ncbi:MAG: lycopene cyclase domain-containing protein, partial [Gammaproteobacteria bacterium]
LFALAAPFIAFPILYWLPWNPIYPGIVAMAIGAAANIACRPDLKNKTWIGGVLFLSYYALFLWGLELIAPGYVDRVCNLEALYVIKVLGLPLEEILFATAFGMYWSGVYEHFTWMRTTPTRQADATLGS